MTQSLNGVRSEGDDSIPSLSFSPAREGKKLPRGEREIGQTHSPVHICMVVGNEYFGASLGKVIQMSLVPQGFRLIATFLFAWALSLYFTP